MNKKLIAPIVVTVLMILYYVIYFGFLISLTEGFWKWTFAIFPLVFGILMITVCLERIKEIKDGAEDDIGQY